MTMYRLFAIYIVWIPSNIVMLNGFIWQKKSIPSTGVLLPPAEFFVNTKWKQTTFCSRKPKTTHDVSNPKDLHGLFLVIQHVLCVWVFACVLVGCQLPSRCVSPAFTASSMIDSHEPRALSLLVIFAGVCARVRACLRIMYETVQKLKEAPPGYRYT